MARSRTKTGRKLGTYRLGLTNFEFVNIPIKIVESKTVKDLPTNGEVFTAPPSYVIDRAALDRSGFCILTTNKGKELEVEVTSSPIQYNSVQEIFDDVRAVYNSSQHEDIKLDLYINKDVLSTFVVVQSGAITSHMLLLHDLFHKFNGPYPMVDAIKQYLLVKTTPHYFGSNSKQELFSCSCSSVPTDTTKVVKQLTANTKNLKQENGSIPSWYGKYTSIPVENYLNTTAQKIQKLIEGIDNLMEETNKTPNLTVDTMSQENPEDEQTLDLKDIINRYR